MTAMDLLTDLVFRASLLALPTSIGLLAFRRLIRSETSNAWFYGAMVALCAILVGGLIPSTFGIGPASATFIASSLLCPLLWLGLLWWRGRSGGSQYGDAAARDDDTRTVERPPLVLTEPLLADANVTPVFRHHMAAEPLTSRKSTNMMLVARAMRGRETSETRRIRKLLPPPVEQDPELPFLRQS